MLFPPQFMPTAGQSPAAAGATKLMKEAEVRFFRTSLIYAYH